MNYKSLKYNIYFLLALLTGILFSCSTQESSIEREADFNFGWKFQLQKDTSELMEVPLADTDWRDVRLPHDWSIEASFDSTLEGCVGYLPGGVGVYQKLFKTTNKKDAKSTFVLFDGVYNNARFWLNGEYLGENPYGYSPVYFNLTDVLNEVGEDNILTVHVDHSRFADSRWYTGSGIYRNVKLITVDKLHIPIWGTFVTTPEVTDAEATVNIEVKVENELAVERPFTLSTVILDASGNPVATTEEKLSIKNKTNRAFNQELVVGNPKLWDTDNPNMYKAITTIVVDGKKVDEYITPFGIRSLRFDKDKGFFLNEKSTYVKGVCLHHDGGLVGVAVPKGVWRRRFEKLKEAGVNAIRTSHNPFSDEFLDLCDEMGFLVQDEIFDEMDNPKDKRFNLNEREVLYHTRGYTEHFQEWGESDLKRTMLRDRNHPSVFQWSIGNEIEWTYKDYKHVSGLWDPGAGGYWNAIPKLTPEEMKARYDALPDRQYKLAETAKRLSKWVKEIDTTRPVTANLIIPVASCATGYAEALDVVGFSYQIKQYDWCKKHYPDMLFTGSENSGYLSEWKSITDNPMVFSMYMWTGIDYIGESNLKWPQKAWPGDLLDLAGFEKAGWNHFKSIWTDEPFIAIQTHALSDSKFKVDNKSGKVVPKGKKEVNWQNFLSEKHWNYKDDETVIVEVVTNLPEAELLLNGKSLGSVKLADCEDNIMRWAVPYEAGKLEAKAVAKDIDIVAELKSASEAANIVVTADKTVLNPDGYDVSHVVVQLVDKDGIPVKTREQEVVFEVEGDVRLLGVDNGWNKSTQDYQANKVVTHLGRCMAIIQSNTNTGTVNIKVSSNGLESQTVAVDIN
ncbi:glycoside hydrolase family 2 TIM barrel-domain containing protein [Saccharicrinis sp. 156]|uniref:glycoside hydrolase family 2 TIM barrel-domain containing protein n=1 Tax=Saccharicrinis sp. 156 TaxID=3417574 RepID=UPI003D342D40